MFGLDNVFNALRSIPFWVADLLVMVLNAVIAALGAVLGTVTSVLPGFPAAPEMPSGVASAVLWIIPVGEIVALTAVMVTAWTVFLGVRVMLNWVKAL